MAKEWNSIVAGEIDMSGDATFAVPGGLILGTSATVLRMLGEYVVSPPAAVVADDAALVIVAIGVFSADAFVLGATAMPDPHDEAGYPWLYWASHPFHFGATTADPNSAAATLRHRFDVRSMRKMKPRETLGVVVQYVDVNGTPPLTINVGDIRVLLAGV